MDLHSGVGEGIDGSNHIPSRMGNCRLKYVQELTQAGLAGSFSGFMYKDRMVWELRRVMILGGRYSRGKGSGVPQIVMLWRK